MTSNLEQKLQALKKEIESLGQELNSITDAISKEKKLAKKKTATKKQKQ